VLPARELRLAAVARMSWPGGHRIPVMRVHLAVLDHGDMDPAPALYAIRINGHLGATVLSAFPAMTSRRDGAHTVLTGPLDRSALYGVLAEVEALGLDLLEVRQLSRPRRSTGSGDYLSP
jgi:endonuclease/exonuclease/phosphatase family metal-dependent hydrolase